MMLATVVSYDSNKINNATKLLELWDTHYPCISSIENHIKKEFRLLLQYAFIQADPNPSSMKKELAHHWVKMSEGFDICELRKEVIRRLAKLLERKDFNIYGHSTERLCYPDVEHTWRWRGYHKKLYQASRKVFSSVTEDSILTSEIRTLPFYKAQAPLFKNSHPGVHDESYVDVVNKIGDLKNSTEITRVLDIGCGEGRLLALLREKYPEAHLCGSNIFGNEEVLNEVLSDSKTTLVSTPAEKMEFQKESFDVIVSTEVIEHLISPEVMVSEIHRLLKPGGVFIVTAPSLHVQFLSKNPETYLFGFLSIFNEKLLPPFHNMYEPLTDIPISHYAFSVRSFQKLFSRHFTEFRVDSTRFIHLKKFGMAHLAPRLPWFRKFGGVVMAYGRKRS